MGEKQFFGFGETAVPSMDGYMPVGTFENKDFDADAAYDVTFDERPVPANEGEARADRERVAWDYAKEGADGSWEVSLEKGNFSGAFRMMRSFGGMTGDAQMGGILMRRVDADMKDKLKKIHDKKGGVSLQDVYDYVDAHPTLYIFRFDRSNDFGMCMVELTFAHRFGV